MLVVTCGARAIRRAGGARRSAFASVAAAAASSFAIRREFHLAGQDAVHFLAEQSPSVKARSVGEKQETPSKSLSILLHADRRPQTFNGRAHFGPTLIGCATDRLPKTANRDSFGLGDVGLVQWSERRPNECCIQPISIEKGLEERDAMAFVQSLGGGGKKEHQLAKGLMAVWKVFEQCEGVYFTFTLPTNQDDRAPFTLVNPFLEFDDFSIHRVAALQDLYRRRARDENSAKAEDGGLFYIKLPNGGNVGSFGYGAGNAMATMDGLALVGGHPANFLDGGGGANKANAKLAIETLNRDKDVRSIFVNTFGGITQTDVVAEGIIEAVREHKMDKPITVRVLGTGAERAKELLATSQLGFSIEDDFKTAAKAAVERASG